MFTAHAPEGGPTPVADDLYPPPLRLDPGWSGDTVTVQAGRPERVPGAPMNPPMTLSSTYVQDAAVEYGRDGNAAWGALEAALGALDGGHCVTFASGLAAATAIASTVPAGGKVVLSSVTYHGVRHIFDVLASDGRVVLCVVPPDDTEAVVDASDGAAMVWVESIANPLLVVADIPAIASAARANGAVSVVDSTFATPLRQRPLALGADIVMHSATKLIGGHSDLLLGAAVCREPAEADRLVTYRHDHGSVPGALEAFLALRGLRTLAVRLDRAEASATELARRLASHPNVAVVHYSGLPDDPQHDRAAGVLDGGFGSMVSLEVAGTVDQTDAFLSRLRLVTHATSLGGVESLIERRSRYPGDAAIVAPTLCRLSVGIENVEDLWSDLDAALRGAFA
jgi:cystathionine gamma-synthase